MCDGNAIFSRQLTTKARKHPYMDSERDKYPSESTYEMFPK